MNNLEQEARESLKQIPLLDFQTDYWCKNTPKDVVHLSDVVKVLFPYLSRAYELGQAEKEKEPVCPECKNVLTYFVSDDYYSKGKKFYSCEVCGWKPKIATTNQCPNGCNGGTVCSECPN